MENKLGQEQAFPYVEELIGGYGEKYDQVTQGMSKRFYAACVAMQSLITVRVNNGNVTFNGEKLTPSVIVKASFDFADELLKQEYDEKTT